MTDVNGCTGVAETLVEISDLPQVPEIDFAGAICEGNDLVLTAPTYNGIDVTYEWIGPDGSTSNGNYDDSETIIVENATTAIEGMYQVQVTVDGCQSEMSEEVQVEVIETILAIANNDGTECIDPETDVHLSVEVSGGVEPITYSWTGPNGFSADVKLPELPNASNDMAGTYTVVITDANGCETTAATVVDITVIPEDLVIEYNGAICEGEQLMLQVPLVEGTDVVYEWIGPCLLYTSPSPRD